ncbi:hypothetical protein ACXY7D_12025 [Sphingomonas melonis]
MMDINNEKVTKRAYGLHKSSAKQRDIAFHFTYEEWVTWWATDERYKLRGNSADSLVMGRKGDRGPYAPENCLPLTRRDNSMSSAGRVRAVSTPKGNFHSIAEAARQNGVNKFTAAHRVRHSRLGWSYTTSECGPPSLK